MFRKLGPHIINSTPQGIAWAKTALCVKAVDNVDPLRLARPEAIKVFRVTGRRSSAEDAVQTILDRLQAYRDERLYVEPDNEGENAWSAQSWRTIIESLHANGIKVAAPSWATGTYEPADWEACRASGWWGADAISVHCYWGG